MSNNSDEKDQTRRRLDPRRQRTRERLVQAVIDELYEVGMSGIRVSAVARRAGAPQSLFYRHFDNIDDALGEVAKQVLAPIVEQDRELRVLLWAASRHDQAVAFYRAAIDRWLNAGPVAELVVTHRSDGSAFAEALKPFFNQIRGQLADEIFASVQAIDVTNLSREQISGLADSIYSLFLSSLESIIDGRQTDLQMAAQLVASGSRGLFVHAVGEFTEADRKKTIEECLSIDVRKQILQARRDLEALAESGGAAAVVESAGGLKGFVDRLIESLVIAYLPPLGPRRATRVRFIISSGDETETGDMICGPLEARPVAAEGAAGLVVRSTVQRLLHGASFGSRLLEGEELNLGGTDVLNADQVFGAFYDVTLDADPEAGF